MKPKDKEAQEEIVLSWFENEMLKLGITLTFIESSDDIKNLKDRHFPEITVDGLYHGSRPHEHWAVDVMAQVGDIEFEEIWEIIEKALYDFIKRWQHQVWFDASIFDRAEAHYLSDEIRKINQPIKEGEIFHFPVQGGYTDATLERYEPEEPTPYPQMGISPSGAEPSIIKYMQNLLESPLTNKIKKQAKVSYKNGCFPIIIIDYEGHLKIKQSQYPFADHIDSFKIAIENILNKVEHSHLKAILYRDINYDIHILYGNLL